MIEMIFDALQDFDDEDDLILEMLMVRTLMEVFDSDDDDDDEVEYEKKARGITFR